MLTDLDVAHGMDHADHMGTEGWRCQQIHRIEQLLDQGEINVASQYLPAAHPRRASVEADLRGHRVPEQGRETSREEQDGPRVPSYQQERVMDILTPRAGDIGEPLKHIEVVPLEEPATVPEEVPA